MSKTEESTQVMEQRADEARDALVSDIQELKQVGAEVVSEAKSKAPWVIGGAVGLVALGIGLSFVFRPKRRWFAPQRRSILGKAGRTAAVSVLGIVARRLATRALSKALPEAQPVASTPSAAPTSAE